MELDLEAELIARAVQHDRRAVDQLLGAHRDRLKGMVRMRLSPLLRSRVDESDIVQEALLDAARKLQEYALAPRLSFYGWLRHLTGLKILAAHRRHLNSSQRSANIEFSIHDGCPEASSILLANRLLSDATSSPEPDTDTSEP